MTKILALIPARGGSKGVKRKNLRKVGNKTLIEHAVSAAKQSNVFEYIAGSTEDPEMTEEFERLGCRSILRPVELAQDTTPTIPVMQHALAALEQEGNFFDWVMLLQTTCPLRNAQDIRNAVEIIEEGNCQSIVSVYQVEHNHPARMYRIENDVLIPIYKEPESRRRQELDAIYHRNGAIYACKTELLLKQNLLISSDVKPFIMPGERSFNIDTELDLFIANQVYKYYQN